MHPGRVDRQELGCPFYSPGKYGPGRFSNLPKVSRRSQTSWGECGGSGAPIFPGLYPALPPAGTGSLVLMQMSCPGSSVWRPAPPLGPWWPVPLKDFAPLIIPSSPASSTFPSLPDLSRQLTNVCSPITRTNSPLVPHSRPRRLLSLLSKQKASKTVYTARLSLDSSSLQDSTQQGGARQVPIGIRVTKPLGRAHLPQPLSSRCHGWSLPFCCAVFFWLW